MFRATISTQNQPIFGGTALNHTGDISQTERMELRVTELDLAHTAEVKRLGTLLKAAQQKLLFSSGRQRD